MKITCMVGNGFDLALGMKTSFYDFFTLHYLRGAVETNTCISRMCVSIAKSFLPNLGGGEWRDWSDAERELGRLDSPILDFRDPVPDFMKCYSDFQKKFIEFMQKQDEVVCRQIEKLPQKDREEFARALCGSALKVGQLLKPFYRTRFYRALASSKDGIELNFITFNYTKVINVILSSGEGGGSVEVTDNNAFQGKALNIKFSLGRVLHAHGWLDEGLLLGVDHLGQIKNEKVREHCRRSLTLVKDDVDQYGGDAFRDAAKELIKQSQIIIAFGLSFGETDSSWWQLLYDHLFKNGGDRQLVSCVYQEGKQIGVDVRGDYEKEYARIFHSLADVNVFEEVADKIRNHIGIVLPQDVKNPDGTKNWCDPLNLDWMSRKLGVKRIVNELHSEDTRCKFDVWLEIQGERGDALAKAAYVQVNLDETYKMVKELRRKKRTQEVGDVIAAEGVVNAKDERGVAKVEDTKTVSSEEGAARGRKPLKEVQIAAEAGARWAQFELGQRYRMGNGVERDFDLAKMWYEKAANKGSGGAQFNLGVMYDRGDGVPYDARLAAEWYRKAAEQGFPEAQFNLAVMLEDGEGVDRDLRQAAKWYRKAAEQGDSAAQFNLAMLYEHGEGVSRDLKQAIRWYQEAAEQGDSEAQFNLAQMYRKGEGVVADLQKAAEWYRKSAEQGDVLAQFNLAVMYHNGEGVSKSLENAAKWYHEAANQGDAMAQFNLALMYDRGDGVGKDARRAFELYEKAAKNGDRRAQFNLAGMYFNGEGVAKDLSRAFKWYLKSATQGDPLAQSWVSRMCYEGLGIDQDNETAEYWSKKVVGSGDFDAHYNLAVMYFKGVGASKNISRVIELLEKAAEKGHGNSLCMLGGIYESGKGVAVDKGKAKVYYEKALKSDDANVRKRARAGLKRLAEKK